MGDDGQVVSRLVTRKIQVAPKVKITIPWMELVAEVNSLRLARKESLRIPLARIRYFTDSSVVLGMLRMKSERFTEFVGARVSGVKVNSNIEEEWLWPIWNCNPADLVYRRELNLAILSSPVTNDNVQFIVGQTAIV
jgi:hypothetical protein